MFGSVAKVERRVLRGEVVERGEDDGPFGGQQVTAVNQVFGKGLVAGVDLLRVRLGQGVFGGGEVGL